MIHDVNKVLLSSKASFGRKDYKYLIGYKNRKQVRPLCLMLPKMSAYRRDFDETPYLLFLIRNNEMLEKYNGIWDKVNNTIKKEFYSEPVYNEKYVSTKIKSYEGEINTILSEDLIPKKALNVIAYQYLSIILIDSVFRIDKNYYTQAFLEECKYAFKKKKMTKYITDDIEISSDEEDSNKESSNDSDKENFSEQGDFEESA